MTMVSHILTAALVFCGLLGTAAVAQSLGGLVTGSFGDQPLEMPVSTDLSGGTLIGTFADAALTATLMEGDQGPVVLTMSLAGEMPAPDEVTLELAFARDMGRNWRGDQGSLTLDLSEFAVSSGIITLSGTVTGEVSGGPASETRPVTFSFDARLEEEN